MQHSSEEVIAIDEKIPWVIFRLQDEFFALSVKYIQSMLRLGKFKIIPNVPDYIRGVADYQGQPVYLIDMRRKLGIQPLDVQISEFQALMDARKQEHLLWIKTLEECVKDGREFTLEVDPQKCQFGRWYTDYIATLKNNNLAFLLRKFREPHQNIHSAAKQATDLLAQGQQELALEAVQKARNGDLDRMIKLFTRLKQLYRSGNSEITIVLDRAYTQQTTGLLVDEIISVEALAPEKWHELDEEMSATVTNLATGMGEFAGIQSLVTTLDISYLAV